VGAFSGGLYREQLRLADARYDRLKRENVDLMSRLNEIERQVGGRSAAAREAQLADSLAHVTQAAAAAAAAAATAAAACTLPAYEPARVHMLLQQLGGDAFLTVGGASNKGGHGYGSRRHVAGADEQQHQDGGRREAGQKLVPALPWDKQPEQGAAARRSSRRSAQHAAAALDASPDLTSDVWSDSLVLTSDAGDAAKQKHRGWWWWQRRGGKATGDSRSAVAKPQATPPQQLYLVDRQQQDLLQGVQNAASGPLAAVAGVVKEVPGALAQVPEWVGAQIDRVVHPNQYGGSNKK